MKTDHIVSMAQRYAKHRGLKLSTVATYALNDGKGFDRMAQGGGCTLRTAERTVLWFARRWPADLSWPADIPRPQASGASDQDAA